MHCVAVDHRFLLPLRNKKMRIVVATLSLGCLIALGCDKNEEEETVEPICPNSSAMDYHIQKPAPGSVVHVGDSLEIKVSKIGNFVSPEVVFYLLMADGATELRLSSSAVPFSGQSMSVKVYIAPSYPVGDFGQDQMSPVTDSALIKVQGYQGAGGTTYTGLSECYLSIKTP